MTKIKFAEVCVKEEGKHLLDNVLQVFQTGGYINGQFTKRFAEQWAEYCGVSYCSPCSSGSAALISSLKFFKKGAVHKYVITPILSFAATVLSIKQAGYTPIYCDVDETGLIDMNQVADAIRTFDDEVEIFLPVHLYGQVLDISDEILSRVIVIEDACQAHGAFRNMRGAAAAFSFYPAKNLGAAGDAGAVVTNNARLADFVRMYVNYGDAPGKKYDHSILGDNLRMDEVQAAFLSAKMDNAMLDHSLQKRIMIASTYCRAGVESFSKTLPHAYHLYPILVDERDKFLALFKEAEIDVGNHYPYMLNKIVPGIHMSTFKNGERIANHVLTLPIGPHMNTTDAERVAEVLKSIATLDGDIWRYDVKN